MPRPGAGLRPGSTRYGHSVPNPIDMPSDQFVTLDGVRFHYLDWGGDGDPLLLLAGLGCTAHVFAELAPHLTDRFRVLALTRRGHGLTDRSRAATRSPTPPRTRDDCSTPWVSSVPTWRALDGRG